MFLIRTSAGTPAGEEVVDQLPILVFPRARLLQVVAGP